MANLCKCNNCNTLLIDENPQINAKDYELRGDEQNMVLIKEEGEFIWVCPNCNTDGYLTDL